MIQMHTPHVGQERKIAVVHNGIIENYLEIKNSLIRKGVVFSSDTDTEVIVQLLEYYYRKKSNLMDAVYAVLNRIKGAYAMGILCSDFPGQMVCSEEKNAPLLIGYGQEGNYIASDVTALLAHTRTVTYMEDDEVAVITADDVQIFDRDRFLLEKEKHLIEWDVSAAEKYAAIIRELQDLPEKISVVMNDLDLYQKAASRYFNHNSVFYIGRNLDYALGLEGSLKLKEISYIHSESYAAGELKHGTISLIEPGTLVVAMVTYEPLVGKILVQYC